MSRPPDLAFVACIEAGVLERQALLLFESIRAYGGVLADCPIYSLAPRAGLGVGRATRGRLDALGVDYIDKVLNTECLEHGSSNRIAAAGYSVQLSHTVVETFLPVRTLAETFQQLLRWARTIRACSPRGYSGLLFGFGVPLALLPLLYHFTGWTLAVLLAALATRWLAAWAAGVVICQDPGVRKNFWLIPLRDAMALGIWLASFSGSEVVWRDTRFRLEPDGKIRPA